MGTKPRVSVVMPAKNAEDTIGDAIESLIAQSMSEWELVVVNDSSTDSTESVVRGYAQRDRRIRLVDARRSGEPAARNVGLEEARGRWIAMLDADDMALPSRLSEQASFLEKHPDLFAVASRAILFVNHARPLALSAVDEPRTLDQLRELKERGHLFVLCHPTLVFDADKLRGVGGYDESFFQACDAELVNRAIYVHDLPVLLMTKPLTWYRISPGGMSSQGLAVQRKVLRYLEERNHTWLDGSEPPSLDDFLSRPVDVRTRLRWLRHDKGAALYRRAGVLLGSGRWASAAVHLVPATLLHPRYVFAKARRQRLKGERVPEGFSEKATSGPGE